MKKNLTELVFILDRSGSMGGLEPDTIGGFNAMLTRHPFHPKNFPKLYLNPIRIEICPHF